MVGCAFLTAAGACGGPLDTTPAEPAQRPPTAGPAPGAEQPGGQPTALRPASGLLFGAPIYDGDFADPFVLAVGDTFYAYATNTTEANLPVIVVRNSPIARYHGDAFPELPAWSEPGFVWGPAVLALGDGTSADGAGARYVLYYATRIKGTGTQCISRAVAADPVGPFVDDSTAPMVCQEELGGSIDPSVVTDADGANWLLYKNDGNCCGLATSIWSQRLAPDGLSVQGEPTELLTADREWEGGLIEGPSMIRDGDRYILFYSGNAWDSEGYGIGWAACESVTGPCRKADGDGPWMGSTTFARGPGGQEFFGALGDVWMVYHGWARGEAGREGAERRLYVDVVRLDDGEPRRVGGRRTGTFLAVLVGVAIALVVAVTWWIRARRRRRSSEARDSGP